ncbi:hypothetical protein CLV56_1772 [Mumia flava]|uniref:ABC3 transporter permease C-terminal domain-containing protein n=1 Tax=Mumia flava TaxID=1348852 RepID=A0A0B2B782_9ACTN|nr:FtsX-like permease family protein [Mumia flava]PJJ57537.1 hypothetical protein CLV56_1772 [Mumia flava]
MSAPGPARLLSRVARAVRLPLAATAAATLLLALLATAAPGALGVLLSDAQGYRIGQLVPSAADLGASVQVVPSTAMTTDDWQPMRGALSDVRDEMGPLLRSATGDAMVTVTLDGRTATPVAPDRPAPPSTLVVGVDPDLASHARIVDGRAPEPPSGRRGVVDVVLAGSVAEAMSWHVGDVRLLTGTSLDDRRFRLTGIYEPVEPDGPFWRHTSAAVEPVVVDPYGDKIVTGTGWVAPDALPGVVDPGSRDGRTDVWFPLDATDLPAAQAPRLLDELAAFTRIGFTLERASDQAQGGVFVGSADLRLAFSTQTSEALRQAQVSASSTTALVAMLACGPAFAGLCVLVLTAGLVRDRARGLLELARARGGSGPQLALGGAVLGLAIGIPGALAGALAALALLPPEAATPWWPAVICALAPAVVLAAVATPRPSVVARVPRIAVEGGAVALALAALVALRQGGLGGATGLDPLAVAVPLLVCLVAVLLAARVLPLLARGAVAWQSRRRGLVGLLGAARARDDRVSTVALAAVVAALAIAVFSGTVVATLDAGRVATAQERAGADVRVDGEDLDPAAVRRLGETPGVRTVATVATTAHVSLADPSGTAYVSRVLVDADALGAVQTGLAGAVPAVDTLGETVDGRVPVVVSSAVADRLDGAEDVEVDGVPARVVGVAPSATPLATTRTWVLMDSGVLGDAAPGSVPVTTVLVDVDPGAEPAVAAEARDLVAPAEVTTVRAQEAALDGDPSVAGVHRAALWSAAVCAALVVVVIAMALLGGGAARARDLAVVRALGLSRVRERGLPVWEVGLMSAAAATAGSVAGLALGLLVLGEIDLRPFTGAEIQPATTLALGWWLVVVGGLVVATALGALLAAVGAGRYDVADTLRMMEE